MVIWSFIPQRAQALKWSFPFSVLLLHLSSSIPSLPSDLPDPCYFHIPDRSVSLKKRASSSSVMPHSWVKRLLGGEVKCAAAGTVSVCDGGPYGTRDGPFFQSEKQTLETRG